MSEKNVIKHWRIQDLFKKVLKSRQLKYPMKIERILVNVRGAPDTSIQNSQRKYKSSHKSSSPFSSPSSALVNNLSLTLITIWRHQAVQTSGTTHLLRSSASPRHSAGLWWDDDPQAKDYDDSSAREFDEEHELEYFRVISRHNWICLDCCSKSVAVSVIYFFN